VKLDYERLGKYLDEIAAETIDIENTFDRKGKKSEDSVQQDPYILKSLKYSTIRDGLHDFRIFVDEIRKIIEEDREQAKQKD